MKLKTIIYLNELWAPGSMSSGDSDLRSWDGVKEGNGWFLYNGSNDYQQRESHCSVCITEGEPAQYWIEVKTNGLRKPTDTNESYKNKIRKYTERVGNAWASTAKRLFKEPKRVTECGNKIMRNWKECFEEAMNDPKLKTFIKNCGGGKRPQKDVAPVMNPVNFTLRV